MAYILTPGFAGISLTETSTDMKVPLGTEVSGSDGNTYKYCFSTSGATKDYIYKINESGFLDSGAFTSSASGVAPQQLFVPAVQFTAGVYGWGVVKGINFNAPTGTSCAADVKIYTSGSGGVFDDSASGHDLVDSLRANTAGGGVVSVSSADFLTTNVQD